LPGGGNALDCDKGLEVYIGRRKRRATT
jgi:hypothetical protein